MKVFNVSPHRSGTMSFHAFCQAHGLRSAHWLGRDFDQAAEATLADLDRWALWRLFEPQLALADCFSDLPMLLLYRQAHAVVPDAKFIMVRRQPAAWLSSVRKHIGERELGFLEKFLYWSATGRRCTHLTAYTDAELLAAYDRLFSETLEYLWRNRCDCSLFRLESPLLGEQLAVFMGIELKHDMPQIHG